jgi:hypothetical protein
MRRIMTPLLIIALALAPLVTVAQTGGNGDIVVVLTTPANVDVEGQFIPVAMGDTTSEDTPMRWMYIAMGGMAALMLATIPIILTAIATSAAAGVATGWAYDYYVAR